MKYSVLILGLGRIASQLEKDPLRYHPCTHAGVVLNSPLSKFFKVTGIYDENPQKIEEFLNDWNFKKYLPTTDLKTIQKQKFDLCIIASSSVSHFKNAQFALSIGIKYILIEKPICTTLQDFQKLKKISIEKKAKIWVNHERRYHPLYNFVRNELNSGNWGKLKTIRAGVLTSGLSPGIAYKDIGGGPLLHDGTHAIDFLDFLIPYLPKVHFSKFFIPKTQQVESRALCLLEYRNDVFAFLEAGGEREYFQFEVDIQTTTNRIILNNDGHLLYQRTESDLYKGFKSLKQIELPTFQNFNPWLYLYKEIISHLSGTGSTILGDLSANERILLTIQKINKFNKDFL